MRLFRNTIVAAVVLAAGGWLPAQTVEPKTAEQTFKNITQLKGTPADQLMPAMQFMAASLGVECGFCHVQGKMDLDDKPAKKTARDMLAMTAAINKNSFGGHQQVTCYSCHHGSAHPGAVPPVLEADLPAHPKSTAVAASGPTVDEVTARWVSGLGGADAMRKITSRVFKGSLLAGGSETPIELFTKAPNKRVSISHTANGG